jgi:hypothetical protein
MNYNEFVGKSDFEIISETRRNPAYAKNVSKYHKLICHRQIKTLFHIRKKEYNSNISTLLNLDSLVYLPMCTETRRNITTLTG